jgi:hypothetical protein
MSVCIPSYMLASGVIAEGMNWIQAILTILLGNLIVLIPMLLNAHAGTKYGIPFPVFVRASFGIRWRQRSRHPSRSRRLRLVWHSDLDRWSGHLFHAPHSLARLRELPRRGLVLFLSFLVRQSLSGSALVLPLENILSLAWPLKARTFFQDSGAKPPAQASPSAPLGVNFVNVARKLVSTPKRFLAASIKTNICWRPPVVASLSTITTTMAGSIFFW